MDNEQFAHNLGVMAAQIPGRLGYYPQHTCVVVPLHEIANASTDPETLEALANIFHQNFAPNEGADAPNIEVVAYNMLMSHMTPLNALHHTATPDQLKHAYELHACHMANLGYDVDHDTRTTSAQENAVPDVFDPEKYGTASDHSHDNGDTETNPDLETDAEADTETPGFVDTRYAIEDVEYLLLVVDHSETQRAASDPTYFKGLQAHLYSNAYTTTSHPPQFVIYTAQLYANEPFYAFDIRTEERFSGNIDTVTDTLSFHQWRQHHNGDMPAINHAEALQRYEIGNTTSRTFEQAAPHAEQIAEYVTECMARNYAVPREHYDDDENMETPILASTHYVKTLCELAHNVSIINNHEYIHGADLILVLQRLAYMLAYDQDESMQGLHATFLLPTLCLTHRDDFPELLHMLFGDANTARVIHTALETLAVMDFSNTDLDPVYARRIRNHTLMLLAMRASITNQPHVFIMLCAYLHEENTDAEGNVVTDLNENVEDLLYVPLIRGGIIMYSDAVHNAAVHIAEVAAKTYVNAMR